MSYKILNTNTVEQRMCKTKTCKNFELTSLKSLEDSTFCPKCGKKVSVITTNKETKYKDKDHVITVQDQVYHASEVLTLKSRSDKSGEIKYKKFQVQSIYAEKNEDGKFVPIEVNTTIPVLSSNFKFDWKVKEYNASVKKSKNLVSNLDGAFNIIKRDWASLVHELCIAREVLLNRGSLKGYTFEKYFKAIGLKKPTVYRWLKIAQTAEENGKTLQEQVDAIGKSGKKGKKSSFSTVWNRFKNINPEDRNEFVNDVIADSQDDIAVLKVLPSKLFEKGSPGGTETIRTFSEFLYYTDFREKLEELSEEYYKQYKATDSKKLKIMYLRYTRMMKKQPENGNGKEYEDDARKRAGQVLLEKNGKGVPA